MNRNQNMYVVSGSSTFILKSMKSHKWNVPELSLDQTSLSYKDHSACMKKACDKIAKIGDKNPFKRKEFRQKVEADESLREDLFYSSFHCDNSFKSFQYQSVVHQAPLSMGFSRQEYWNGCHSLLQGIFLTQGLNLSLLYCRQILFYLSHQGIPSHIIRID